MKTILLVENDPFIAGVYGKKFRKEGYQVDIANNGQMALEKIKHHYPDVLVLDTVLPKMDGWNLLKRIRNDLGLKNLKVIILSNAAYKDCAKDVSSLGVEKYFLKAEKTSQELALSIAEVLK
ncbi:MAG: hypothetical protein A3A98_00580 [Candidatus Staskawiczbacteria bacterium RIFCSPLOWO2_01_FULL_40_39]|uniref:Response regulatory domain-containing protein n=1 Tax=Candidatus Staskawiczbacteria bacterium RIFCSPHIGHO2_01_FULL_39_25 TaxID=1802202 RepID=A0A1G2HMV3_9BACT|nr:MAG: hypothetical protein A2730_00580 [Candidatus Staskawiczbacteria bacterium RIFCSPHIGHO2_01_FULL_39_25]OGZ73230.1 MAG: hypothetical protein A3A98_00580 [Candidatus Staskawiczbacteria bacterium RIFCSPLOWO2_01_FULL_40_39]OGZ76407.1 MAG: hypothetical protein A3I87_01795 [Candidatus Staskawiczbacteria bacterium RIFCSPLOWO2_02_FULL_39_8]